MPRSCRCLRLVRMWVPGKRCGSCRNATPPATPPHGAAVFVNTRGSYVASERQLVALLGVDNVVVVHDRPTRSWWRGARTATGLRRVVSKLKEVAPALTEDHLKVHRPWGSYQSLDLGERYQVQAQSW